MIDCHYFFLQEQLHSIAMSAMTCVVTFYPVSVWFWVLIQGVK